MNNYSNASVLVDMAKEGTQREMIEKNIHLPSFSQFLELI